MKYTLHFFVLHTFMVLPMVMVVGRVAQIRKCCPLDQVIDVNQMKCRNSGVSQWTPRFYKDDTEELTDMGYEVVPYKPQCSEGSGVHILPLKKLTHLSIPEAKFRLSKSGRLLGKHLDGSWVNIPENSCIDGIMNYGEGREYTAMEVDQAIISCPLLE